MTKQELTLANGVTIQVDLHPTYYQEWQAVQWPFRWQNQVGCGRTAEEAMANLKQLLEASEQS